MRSDPPKAQFRFACFHCRKMHRKTLLRSCYPGVIEKSEAPRCAECGSPVVFVGRYFEPPRRNDLKAWKQLELRYTKTGSYLASSGKYYANLPREAVKLIQQEAEQKLLGNADEQKKRHQLQKRQERLASRSRPGRSLTSQLEMTDMNWF
ncbi:MAG: hypothetical protein ACRYFS_26055 [Janthinobacterium lividum]